MLRLKILLTKLFNRALLKLYSSGGLGYFTGSFGGGKEFGQPGRIPSVVFNIGDWQFHFHHWFLASAILISICFLRFKKHKSNLFVSLPAFGFLLGLILHGIFNYDDWNMILTRVK